MPVVQVPCVLPSHVTFYSNLESTSTQRIAILNPFAFDILYKVDNARPDRYAVSNRQGVVSARQKLYLELTCLDAEDAQDDGIQIRFFKWSRPYQGHRHKAQQYIGFREVRLSTQVKRDEGPDDVGTSLDTWSHTSGSQARSAMTSGSSVVSDHDGHGHNSLAQTGHRLHIISNITIAVLLLLTGFLLNKTGDEWFTLNVVEGVKPQTLAIVAYTLAGVVIMKLLTFR